MKNVFKKNASGMKGIGLMLVVLLMIGCSKEESPLTMTDEPSDAMLKSAAVVNGFFDLIGESHFPSYAVKEHKVISPWELNKLACIAILTIDGKNFMLETEEYMGPMLLRTITFNGHITPGGKVRFSWPDTWWEIDGNKTIDGLADQFLLHTGCIPFGPGNSKGTFGMNYKGNFDGVNFYASAHFMAKQVQFGMVPFYSEAVLGELVEGPIQFEFSIELEVVESGE